MIDNEIWASENEEQITSQINFYIEDENEDIIVDSVDIMSCTLKNNISVINSSLPNNSFSMVISNNNTYSFTNKQKIALAIDYGEDGYQIYGYYYVESIEREENKSTFTLNAVNVISILNQIDFDPSVAYANVSSSGLRLSQVLSAVNTIATNNGITINFGSPTNYNYYTFEVDELSEKTLAGVFQLVASASGSTLLYDSSTDYIFFRDMTTKFQEDYLISGNDFSYNFPTKEVSNKVHTLTENYNTFTFDNISNTSSLYDLTNIHFQVGSEYDQTSFRNWVVTIFNYKSSSITMTANVDGTSISTSIASNGSYSFTFSSYIKTIRFNGYSYPMANVQVQDDYINFRMSNFDNVSYEKPMEIMTTINCTPKVEYNSNWQFYDYSYEDSRLFYRQPMLISFDVPKRLLEFPTTSDGSILRLQCNTNTFVHNSNQDTIKIYCNDNLDVKLLKQQIIKNENTYTLTNSSYSSSQTLQEIKNPLVNGSSLATISSNYINNYINKDYYEASIRFDPRVQVGDRVQVEDKSGTKYSCIVLDENITYNGGLKSNTKLLIDGATLVNPLYMGDGSYTSSTEYSFTIKNMNNFTVEVYFIYSSGRLAQSTISIAPNSTTTFNYSNCSLLSTTLYEYFDGGTDQEFYVYFKYNNICSSALLFDSEILDTWEV